MQIKWGFTQVWVTVLEDLRMSQNAKYPTVLILLHLSAVVGMVTHSIITDQLVAVGLCSIALS